jgi:hypothetical protein
MFASSSLIEFNLVSWWSESKGRILTCTFCFYTYTFYFLYSYILFFIFYTHTLYFLCTYILLIKLARRHARCIHNKLAVLQHKSIVEFLSWSSAFDICKHDSNRAIFDVDYQAWIESFFKKLRCWCSSQTNIKLKK